MQQRKKSFTAGLEQAKLVRGASMMFFQQERTHKPIFQRGIFWFCVILFIGYFAAAIGFAAIYFIPKTPTGNYAASYNTQPAPVVSWGIDSNGNDCPFGGCTIAPTQYTFAPVSKAPTYPSPTLEPTPPTPLSPSRQPTLAPSAPTLETTRPTPLPTFKPSFSPSKLPTKLPTLLPTVLPTMSPTNPTQVPTMSPTYLPTMLPTELPSIAPTQLPTKLPTSKSPTKLPTSEPTLSPVCFHKDSTVELESGQHVSLTSLKYGDRVLALDSATQEYVFSPVVTFTGYFPNEFGAAIRMELDNQDHLVLSPGHLVFAAEVADFSYFQARELKVGMFVYVQHRAVRIANIKSSMETGWISPLTGTGNVVVNNVLCSCHTTGPHDLVRFLYQPLHTYYDWFPRVVGQSPQEGEEQFFSIWFRRGIFGRSLEVVLRMMGEWEKRV